MGQRGHHQHGRGQKRNKISRPAVDQNKSHKQNSPAGHPAAAPTAPEPVVVNTDARERIGGQEKSDADKANYEALVAEYTRSLRNWTKGLVFVGLVTAVVLFLQWKTFEKSDDTARAAQRPWMKFDGLEITEPLSYEDKVAKTKVKFHLRNTGNSPAVDVITRAKLIILDLADRSEPHAYCDTFRDEPTPVGQLGYASFPGIEPIEEEGPISVDLSKANLTKYQTNLLAPPRVIFYANGGARVPATVEPKIHCTVLVQVIEGSPFRALNVRNG
jgi:hypothetical protein